MTKPVSIAAAGSNCRFRSPVCLRFSLTKSAIIAIFVAALVIFREASGLSSYFSRNEKTIILSLFTTLAILTPVAFFVSLGADQSVPIHLD